MNRRGKRIAFTVAATGLAVLLVVGILYRDAVRDHIEAWRFQLTRAKRTIAPDPAWKPRLLDPPDDLKFNDEVVGAFDQDGKPKYFVTTDDLLQVLANSSDCPAILCPTPTTSTGNSGWTVSAAWLTSDGALILLRNYDWRVIEQRFPWHAYVVIRDQGATP